MMRRSHRVVLFGNHLDSLTVVLLCFSASVFVTYFPILAERYLGAGFDLAISHLLPPHRDVNGFPCAWVRSHYSGALFDRAGDEERAHSPDGPHELRFWFWRKNQLCERGCFHDG